MEEKWWEAVTGTSIDDHGAKPPAQARWPYQQRVDSTDGNSKGIVANRALMGGNRWWWGYEVGLAGRRVTLFVEVNFDVNAGSIAKGCFG